MLKKVILSGLSGSIVLRHILPKKDFILTDDEEETHLSVGRTNMILFDHVSYWVDCNYFPCFRVNKYSWRRLNVIHNKSY